MPTYDYKCENCNHAFELFQSMKDDPVRVCPSCGEEAVRRLIGAGAGLVFKGSGFYLTDYVRNGNGKSQGAPASKESASSDSKNADSSPGSGGSSEQSTGSSGSGSSGNTDGGANTKNEGSSGEGGSSKSTASKGASSTDSAPSSSSKAA